MNAFRTPHVDFLLPLSKTNVALFIPNDDEFNKINWTVYFEPYSLTIRIMLLSFAITCSLFVIFISWAICQEKPVSHFFVQFLLAANFLLTYSEYWKSYQYDLDIYNDILWRKIT